MRHQKELNKGRTVPCSRVEDSILSSLTKLPFTFKVITIEILQDFY